MKVETRGVQVEIAPCGILETRILSEPGWADKQVFFGSYS